MARTAETLPRDLGGGLVLRRATPDDTEAIVAFNRRTHSWSPGAPLQEGLGIWTRELLDGTHPGAGVDDFTVMEDTATGVIVSTLCLIAQTWSYGGIAIPVGRPELVGTDPAYRRRGLVRAQMEVIHGWSAARGDLALGITGIPWYYRQFGYEMTLGLDGGRLGYAAQLPDDTGDQPFTLRPATEADLPFLAETYAAGMARYAAAARLDEAWWRYELTGRRAGSLGERRCCVIEDSAGEAVGLLIHWPFLLEGRSFVVEAFEVRPGTSWLAAMPGVLGYVRATAEGYAAAGGAGQSFATYAFLLGTQHPVYAATPRWLPQERRPYAWFVRVPDLPRFIHAVTPVIERRLAASPLAGYSGERRISFYRDGLRLAFERGRLAAAAGWRPSDGAGGDCAFPGLTFLHLLFGHRSLAEVQHLFADCWADGESAALLDAIFPTLPSSVWGIA